jgi:hypothetical protein
LNIDKVERIPTWPAYSSPTPILWRVTSHPIRPFSSALTKARTYQGTQRDGERTSYLRDLIVTAEHRSAVVGTTSGPPGHVPSAGTAAEPESSTRAAASPAHSIV